MTKRSPWFYIFFGIYPISLFDLGNSKTSLPRQVIILSFITSALVRIAHLFHVLNVISFISILIALLTPYFIGRLFYIGIIE